MTRLGERVIADIRRAIYDRVIGMSPGFYERIMTGEVLSRLTTDTTLVLSVIGSSVSVALRNVLMLVGGLALLLVTSPKLTALVLVVVPLVVVPILDARAAGQGAVAREPGPDRRRERAGVREPARGADGAGLHPRGGEPGGVRRARSSARSTPPGGGSGRGRR